MLDVLLGSQRWRRRRAVARLGQGSVDPFGRPRFLYLTDTHRKRQAVLDEFATRGVFEPPVAVLGAFLHDLWVRWGDGRPLWGSRAIALLAIPIVEASSFLRSLGAPEETARGLATLLDASLHTPLRPAHPEVQRALEALRQATDGDRLHPTLGLQQLPDRLRSPAPALQRWIGLQPRLVIDDILQPSPLRIRCLLALIDAWDAAGLDVTIAFACGDDPTAVLTGEEEGGAFAATRALRRAVFEHLVANGRAEVHVALPEGPAPLHDHLPVPPEVPPVRVQQAASVDDEIRTTLDALQQRLLAGSKPEQCAIAVADESRYAAAVQRRAARRGLPVIPAGGTLLKSTPVGRVLLHCLRARQGLLSPQGWLGLAQDLDRPVRQLARILAPAGIQRGGPDAWVARLDAWSVGNDQPWLEEMAAVAGLQDQLTEETPPLPLKTWSEAWRDRWQRIGVAALMASSELNQRAWFVAQGALDDLVVDLELTGLGDPDLELQRALVGARVPLPASGAVPVIGLQELRGLTPDHLWVLGLDRSWPAPPAVSPLVERTEAQRLAPVDRVAEGRYLLAQLMRNATEVTLSWPETVGTRASFPSALLQDLGLDTERTAATPLASEPAPLLEKGHLDRAPDIERRFGVTSAEVAVRCPARFWYGKVLGLRPDDPWDPELEPRRRGTAFHAILQRFYEDRDLRPVDDYAATAPALHRAATEVLDALEAQGGFEPVLQAWARGRWLAGLVDNEPKGLLGAWLLHELDRGIGPEAVERAISVERSGIRFTGVLDRIERGAEGALVVDYKTGSPPTRTAMEAGLALQPLIYLEALGPGSHASAFQRVSRPDDVNYTGWFGDAASIRSWGGRSGVAVDTEQRRVLLDQAVAELETVVQGAVGTTQHGPDLGGCSYCRFARVCRVVHPC